MSVNERPQQDSQENPEQRERMGALEGIKSQLANLRAAVERPQESAEKADESQSAAEAFKELAGAMERARALHKGLEDSDPNKQAWLNVEEDILGSTEGVDIAQNLASGLEDAVEQTDAAQEQLAALASDFDDELSPDGAVQEYLDRFRLTPSERVGNAIERHLEKARKNPQFGPMIAKAESLFRTVGINLEDVLNVVKNMVFSKLEGLPFRVGMVEDARLNDQLAQLTDAQKKLVTPEIKQEWRGAYSRWAANPTKVFKERPYIKVKDGKIQVVEPSEELVAEAPDANANVDVFGVKGLRMEQPLAMAGNPGFSVQVKGATAGLKLGEVERGGKKFSFVDKKDEKTRITINTLTAKSTTDPGQIDILLSTGETIQLVSLVDYLDRAVASAGTKEAEIEIPVGTRTTIRASSGKATT